MVLAHTVDGNNPATHKAEEGFGMYQVLEFPFA
jgi:hypothetical protein